jgi:hypothetical protein
MLLDQLNVFSDKQALRATGASTNTIDLTAAGNAVQGALFVMAHVDTAFAGATQVVVAIQTAADSAFTSPVTLASFTLNATALANTNDPLFAAAIPVGLKRYLRAYYTVTGTITAGNVSCFVADGIESK